MNPGMESTQKLLCKKGAPVQSGTYRAWKTEQVKLYKSHFATMRTSNHLSLHQNSPRDPTPVPSVVLQYPAVTNPTRQEQTHPRASPGRTAQP